MPRGLAVNWAGVNTLHATSGDNATTFSINFWFRTDVSLARMWIER